MDCGDSRCGNDLISGSPDQQDWSLISGGREGVVLIISCITVSYANKKQTPLSFTITLPICCVMFND